jgi:RimJ/RimL family protein N-acetyltransferase
MTRLPGQGIVIETSASDGMRIRLREMTEADWDVLYKWNNDPEVSYWYEEDASGWSLEDMKNKYRSVREKGGFCFIAEAEGKPLGECWLQPMNIKDISEKHPGKDLRRIDLMIGEKAFWGRGVGSAVLFAVTEFGFMHEGADMIFGCFVADNNLGILRVLDRAGYVLYSREKTSSARREYNLTLYQTRERFMERRQQKEET